MAAGVKYRLLQGPGECSLMLQSNSSIGIIYPWDELFLSAVLLVPLSMCSHGLKVVDNLHWEFRKGNSPFKPCS
jgi:hypothetical protein